MFMQGSHRNLLGMVATSLGTNGLLWHRMRSQGARAYGHFEAPVPHSEELPRSVLSWKGPCSVTNLRSYYSSFF